MSPAVDDRGRRTPPSEPARSVRPADFAERQTLELDTTLIPRVENYGAALRTAADQLGSAYKHAALSTDQIALHKSNVRAAHQALNLQLDIYHRWLDTEHGEGGAATLSTVMHRGNNHMTGVIGAFFQIEIGILDNHPAKIADGLTRLHGYSDNPPYNRAQLIEAIVDVDVELQLRRGDFGPSSRPPRSEYLVSVIAHQAVAEFLSTLSEHERSLVNVAVSCDENAKRFITHFDTQWREVLIELMTNGHRAIGEAKGTISIELQGLDKTLVVSVADSGSGIPPELHTKIFESGFSTRESRGEGLAAVKLTVENFLRGLIRVESGDAPGTTFVIEVPALDVETVPRA